MNVDMAFFQRMMKLEVGAGFRARLELIVGDWMRRRKIVPSVTESPQFNPALYYAFLLTTVCQAVKEDPMKLVSGHTRTRKRLQRKCHGIMFGQYDQQLEGARVFWKEVQDGKNK